MDRPIEITVDFREKKAGIPELLVGYEVKITFVQLPVGDYLLNNRLIVERKTNDDFVQSLITGRLFDQCSRLKKSGLACLFIIEGSPFRTSHNISGEAVRGALLSIMVSWQIPVYFSPDKASTAQLLMLGASQQLQSHQDTFRRSGKPKKIKNRQVWFLQGLPQVGYQIAQRLLAHFGNIENIILSDIDDLIKVKGIGKGKAKKIVEFIKMK